MNTADVCVLVLPIFAYSTYSPRMPMLKLNFDLLIAAAAAAAKGYNKKKKLSVSRRTLCQTELRNFNEAEIRKKITEKKIVE